MSSVTDRAVNSCQIAVSPPETAIMLPVAPFQCLQRVQATCWPQIKVWQPIFQLAERCSTDLVQRLVTHIMCSAVRSVPHIYWLVFCTVEACNGVGCYLQMVGLSHIFDGLSAGCMSCMLCFAFFLLRRIELRRSTLIFYGFADCFMKSAFYCGPGPGLVSISSTPLFSCRWA